MDSAFPFLAAFRSLAAGHDPHLFAIAAAGVGAACGAIGLLTAGHMRLRRELRALARRAEDLADRNWELTPAERRELDRARVLIALAAATARRAAA